MKIGIDVDETLLDTQKSFEKVINKYNLKLKCKYIDNWTKKEYEILQPYFKEILIGAKLKKNAKSVISKLNEAGHELYVITARSNKHGEFIETSTQKQLKVLNIKSIYFDCKLKWIMAKKLNLDLMIDDSLDVYNSLKRNGVDCILFGDKIKTWNEILKYIERKKNG